MVLMVVLLQIFRIDVSVDLGGTDVGMTQQLLDRPQVGAAFKQVRRKTVPEGVYFCRYSHRLSQFVKPFPHAFPGKATPQSVYKNSPFTGTFHEFGPGFIQVSTHPTDRFFT
jgi:hypothetical protein